MPLPPMCCHGLTTVGPSAPDCQGQDEEAADFGNQEDCDRCPGHSQLGRHTSGGMDGSIQGQARLPGQSQWDACKWRAA